MEGKASPKREFKQLRSRNQKAALRRSNYLLEAAIAQAKAISGGGGGVVSHVNEGGGVVRMKILVKKQDLKQMLGMINGGRVSANQLSSSTVSVEERLNLLRRKHLTRSNAVKKSRRSWSPELQSIPEE